LRRLRKLACAPGNPSASKKVLVKIDGHAGQARV